MINIKAIYIEPGTITGTSYVEVNKVLLLVPTMEVKLYSKVETPTVVEEKKLLATELAIGVRVKHLQRPEWGVGTISSCDPLHRDSDYDYGGICPWKVTWDTDAGNNYWNCSSKSLEIVDE